MPPALRSSYDFALFSRPVSLGALLCVLAMASPAQSESEGTKATWFTTPGHAGAMVLEIPAKWNYQTRTAGGRPTNIKIVTDGPEINLTLLWNVGKDPGFNSPEQLRTTFTAASAPYATHDVNSDFETKIEQLSGSEVAGLYTTLQNPDLVGVTELADDQYRILTPGIFSVGEFQVFFSMISREADSTNRLLAFEMFRGARFEQDASTRTDRGISVPVTLESGRPLHARNPDGHGEEAQPD